jgi:dihydrofolate synthase/folylpolyglutamate synthase
MNESTAYQQSLEYLYSFIDFSRTHQKEVSRQEFSLVNMQKLMVSLGEPYRAYPIIHVAGSKGKGSVSALCATALQSQGYKVGLYTSPHLKKFTERIQVNREEIPESDFVDMVNAIKLHVAEIPGLTTFEIATAIGFWYFLRQEVDVAVIEVGLGGRLDATNVLTPIVSVITALYLDHTAFLGDTLPMIAAEKAGIIKEGVPVVCAPHREDASSVIARIAEEKHAPKTQVGTDYRYTPQSFSLEGQVFHVLRGKGESQNSPVELRIKLLGEHQVENATTAYAALQLARGSGLAISEEAITRGFAKALWPGRFEVLHDNPYLVIDSAHMPGATNKLIKTLDDYLPGKSVVLVFGVSADKDVKGMLENLKSRIRLVIATQSDHPRAMDTDNLLELMRGMECPVRKIPVVADALDEAMGQVGENEIVLVTGSIFVVASARIAWMEKQGGN